MTEYILNSSTLHFFERRKAVNSGKPLRAKRGPKPKLDSEDEALMAEYLKECWLLRIPKRKIAFLEEVSEYMECYEIKNTFPNTVPGNTHEFICSPTY